MKFIKEVDLNGWELQNAVIQNLASAPANPKPGQLYYNTTDNVIYVYDGTSWVNAMSQGNYTFEDGVEEDTNRHVKVVFDNTNKKVQFAIVNGKLTADVVAASNTATGIIRIATDAEVSTGTAENIAVNPKQLATKVDKNSPITAGTGTVVNYDAKGLVTGSSEIGIKSNSTNYIEFDTTNHQIGAKVDTTVTEGSTNLVTSGAVKSAIDSAVASGVKYITAFNITTATTSYSGINLPVKKGYLYNVEGTGPATIDGIEWNPGDYLLIDEDVAVGGTLDSSKLHKVDNTESADIVRLSATQTLTNKTLDADNNTISNLELDNFKSGVVRNSTAGIRNVATASDTSFATEKAIATLTQIMANGISATNPALTPSGGVCSWTISNTLATANCVCQLFIANTGEKVEADFTVTANSVTVELNSADTVAAGTYKAVIIGF